MKPAMSIVDGVNGTMLGRNSYVTQIASDRRQATAQKLHLKIGAWNVRALYRAGQEENVVQEMK